MKTRSLMLAIALAGSLAVSHAAVLPDACGNKKIHFDVTPQKQHDAPAPPAEGKAKLIVVETLLYPKFTLSFSDFDTRYGVDGNWIGATIKNSFFAVDLAPGDHQLCYDGGSKDKIGVIPLTVEAGKTYYYEMKIQGQSVGSGQNRSILQSASFEPLSVPEGQYRVKASDLSSFNQRK